MVLRLSIVSAFVVPVFYSTFRLYHLPHAAVAVVAELPTNQAWTYFSETFVVSFCGSSSVEMQWYY